jgi:hypothetical protein
MPELEMEAYPTIFDPDPDRLKARILGRIFTI